jgi:hypothetical protein
MYSSFFSTIILFIFPEGIYYRTQIQNTGRLLAAVKATNRYSSSAACISHQSEADDPAVHHEGQRAAQDKVRADGARVSHKAKSEVIRHTCGVCVNKCEGTRGVLGYVR